MEAALVQSNGQVFTCANNSGGTQTIGAVEKCGEVVTLLSSGAIGATGPDTTVLASGTGQYLCSGVIEAPKVATGGAVVAGQRAYWDATNNRFTPLADGTVYAGVFYRDATQAATRCYVLLNALAKDDGLQYANETASTVSPAGTAEAAFDKAYTIAANRLKIGDVIKIRASVFVVNQNSTNTLLLKLKIGSTEIIATAAVDVATSDVGHIDADLVIRTIGATGTFYGRGTQAIGVPGTVTAKPYVKAETTIDTTADQAITVTYTWSASNADNQARLDVLTVELVRK